MPQCRLSIRALLLTTIIATAALAAPVPLKSESWPLLSGLPDCAVLRAIDGDTIEV